MATFKVGQRVRIVCPPSYFHGREATVWKIEKGSEWHEESVRRAGLSRSDIGYCVDIDGYGRILRDGHYSAFPAWMLAPLTDGESDEWAKSKVRSVTKPSFLDVPIYTPYDVKEKV